MTERKETPVMEIKEIRSRKKEFLPLLLMGDEEERMIDRYLERGTLYAAEIGKKTAAVCVVTEEEGFAEVKNLAVAPEWRRQGIGRALLEWAGASYRDRYTRLRLGTGDVSPALAFYRRCGFRAIGRLQEFFTKNYSRPIYEEGRLLRDMIILEKTL